MKKFIDTVSIFFGFLWLQKPRYLLAVFCFVAHSVFSSTQPYFYRSIINELQSGNPDKLVEILVVYVFVLMIVLLFANLRFIVADVVVAKSIKNARGAIFDHLQDLDFAFHSTKSTGSLISLFKRGDNAFMSFFYTIHERIVGIILSFIIMSISFVSLDYRLFLLVIFSFLLTLLATKFFVGLNLRARRYMNECDDDVSAVVVDNMINYETVKYFSRERWESARLNEKSESWTKAFKKYSNSFRIIDTSVGLIINISIFLVLLLSLQMNKRMELSIGDIVFVISFVSLFYPTLFDLVYQFRDIAKHFADLERYFDILNHKIEVKDPLKPNRIKNIKGEIHFDKVNFSYADGKKGAIKDTTLNIRQGQSIALVGRSGSGKTTLTKLLLRFYDIDSGSIKIDGIDIRDMKKSYLRSFIGIVPQEPVMFNNTIAYNIGYGKENANLYEVRAAAKMANLDKFITTLQKGYETNVGERGIKLSGGQKQRMAIARMILSDPEIIIFDEATSQLDSENEKRIQNAFWKVARNKTTIIIAHRLATAMKADKIVVMDDGMIQEIGSHNELIQKENGLYKYLWNLQMKDR